MEGILLDPLQVKNSAGTTIDPATADLQTTLQELVSRLDTLASCKYHLTEALRVQLVGTLVTQGVSGTVAAVDSTQTNYYAPIYARFLNHMAVGNQAAIQSNINNVVV